jgi:hypothetical protein
LGKRLTWESQPPVQPTFATDSVQFATDSYRLIQYPVKQLFIVIIGYIFIAKLYYIHQKNKNTMMQKLKKIRVGVLVVIMLYATLFPLSSSGKPSIGILPVNIRSVSSANLNEQQLQSLSLLLQDYFTVHLKDIVIVSPLSREHILLLMKEVPAPDPEELTAEAYKIISKKENLMYLLQCSVESLQVQNENARIIVNMIIVEGSSGKKFWAKKITGNKKLSTPLSSEHILLNELFKPILEDVMKEIKTLSL